MSNQLYEDYEIYFRLRCFCLPKDIQDRFPLDNSHHETFTEFWGAVDFGHVPKRPKWFHSETALYCDLCNLLWAFCIIYSHTCILYTINVHGQVQNVQRNISFCRRSEYLHWETWSSVPWAPSVLNTQPAILGTHTGSSWWWIFYVQESVLHSQQKKQLQILRQLWEISGFRDFTDWRLWWSKRGNSTVS